MVSVHVRHDPPNVNNKHEEFHWTISSISINGTGECLLILWVWNLLNGTVSWVFQLYRSRHGRRRISIQGLLLKSSISFTLIRHEASLTNYKTTYRTLIYILKEAYTKRTTHTISTYFGWTTQLDLPHSKLPSRYPLCPFLSNRSYRHWVSTPVSVSINYITPENPLSRYPCLPTTPPHAGVGNVELGIQWSSLQEIRLIRDNIRDVFPQEHSPSSNSYITSDDSLNLRSLPHLSSSGLNPNNHLPSLNSQTPSHLSEVDISLSKSVVCDHPSSGRPHQLLRRQMWEVDRSN